MIAMISVCGNGLTRRLPLWNAVTLSVRVGHKPCDDMTGEHICLNISLQGHATSSQIIDHVRWCRNNRAANSINEFIR